MERYGVRHESSIRHANDKTVARNIVIYVSLRTYLKVVEELGVLLKSLASLDESHQRVNGVGLDVRQKNRLLQCIN
jgi:hypothetical protein